MNRPDHVAPALQGLRGWVVLSACVVAIASLVQLGTFVLVEFTSVRTTQVEAPPGPPRVVTAAPDTAPTKAAPAQAKITTAPAPSLAQGPMLASRPAGQVSEPVDPNKVRSVTDRNLELFSNAASVAGVLGAAMLLACVSLGLVLATSASVPGVQHAVPAFAWSVVVFVMATPWSWLSVHGASAWLPGVLCGYDPLTRAADAERGLGGGAMAVFVLLPCCAAGLCVYIIHAFTTGLRPGLVIRHVSELEEAAEREMAEIRSRGVGTLQPGQMRVVGALHQVLGEAESPASEPPARKAAGGESFRRPI